MDIHYLTYDPEEIWNEMMLTYIEEGGDILYPGDEKEMLLRGVQAIITQVFAGVDNALRMQTLRYAVGEYLDILGEQRDCARIDMKPAKTTVEIEFVATGRERVIPAGTALTADGVMFYTLDAQVRQTGYPQLAAAAITCSEPGIAGNGLLKGASMQFAINYPAVVKITVLQDAADGNDREDDETYRERIRLHGLASVTTGPASQYERMAKSVSGMIIDAKAVNEGAGNVGVYLIIRDGGSVVEIKNAVIAALSADDVRPLTDNVTVDVALPVEYTLNVEYYQEAGVNITDAINAAATEYQEWQDNTIGRAFNPDKLMAMLYQAGAMRVAWGAGSNFDGGAVEYTAIGENEHCDGAISLAAITA